MSEDLERRYRRLLGFYPKRWRQEHGEILLGTLLDVAEAEGRNKPTLSTRLSLTVHGIAERVSLQVAIWLTAVALVLSATGTILQFMDVGSSFLPRLIGYILVSGVSAWLLVVALSGLLRVLGWLSHSHSLIGAALAFPSLTLTSVTAMSWSVGFAEADADMEPTAFSNAFISLFILAFAFGMLSSAVFIDGLLESKVRSQLVRRLIAIMGGVVLALAAGFFVITPMSVPACAALSLVATLWAKNYSIATVVSAPVSPEIDRPLPAIIRQHSEVPSPVKSSLVSNRLLAGISAFLGVVCVLFALTGSTWPGVEMDSTQSMRVGLATGALAGIPLLGSLARLWGRERGAFNGPLILIAITLLVMSAENFFGDGSGDWRSLAPLGIGLVISSIAVGWGSAVLLDAGRSAASKYLIATAIGVGFAFTFGFMWVVALPFILPVGAAIVLFWRSPRKALQSVDV